jgi:hypothetical protein
LPAGTRTGRRTQKEGMRGSSEVARVEEIIGVSLSR